MHDIDWQKSSYSNEGVNCLNLASIPDPARPLRLRESDDPSRILSVTPSGLAALLVSIKSAQ